METRNLLLDWFLQFCLPSHLFTVKNFNKTNYLLVSCIKNNEYKLGSVFAFIDKNFYIFYCHKKVQRSYFIMP